jgi:hypothetical protein
MTIYWTRFLEGYLVLDAWMGMIVKYTPKISKTEWFFSDIAVPCHWKLSDVLFQFSIELIAALELHTLQWILSGSWNPQIPCDFWPPESLHDFWQYPKHRSNPILECWLSGLSNANLRGLSSMQDANVGGSDSLLPTYQLHQSRTSCLCPKIWTPHPMPISNGHQLEANPQSIYT